MSAPESILNLISNFERNHERYVKGHYNETQVRRDFIDPFFTALGWDMDNKSGYAEDYRDVIHEDAIKIGSSMRAPDYSFRVGGTRKFFVEAKKPSVKIKDDPDAAFQLRRYGWSAKLSLSILTDFEEFAIYDCRIKPDKSDKASTARLFYFTYKDIAEKWNEISGIFSKEAVLQGSFDKFANTTKGKRGTTEVDDEFLMEIEGWRISLASNIALRNTGISTTELNYAVQQTIDRIIFLRICEDRGIEPYGRLHGLTSGTGVYARLQDIFYEADDKYNSGLFHYKKEKGRLQHPDELTPSLQIDDKPIKEIFKKLYYPECPYEFSVIGADILGSVYEQFLGKIIKIAPGRKPILELKPEVRKAGGVYYTPAYVVKYMIKHSVGRVLATRSLKQAAGMRIVDPACGSGSFLIGAYQFLLDWYQAKYFEDGVEKHSKGKQPRLRSAGPDKWHLTTTEKKRILLEHIFGVDIDAQAVEVTKLSLLLKVLEGESAESIGTSGKLFHERVLPDLDENIRCGNSLISSDFCTSDRTEEQIRSVNSFDWEDEFPSVFSDGGFDVIVGNPPYIDVKEMQPEVKTELSRIYRSAQQRFDLYVPFIEKGLQLLRPNGYLSYIVPSMFMRREYGINIRKVILEESNLSRLVDFGTNQVFKGPLNYVAILILDRNVKRRPFDVVTFNQTGLDSSDLEKSLNSEVTDPGVSRFRMKSTSLTTDAGWQFVDEAKAALAKRLFSSKSCLEDVAKYVSEGIHSGKDEVFFIPRARADELKLEPVSMFPLAKGKDVHRYESVDAKNFAQSVLYTYDLTSGCVLPEPVLKEELPLTWAYLKSSRHLLAGRTYFDKSSKEWYELWCPRDPELFTGRKILGPEIANKGEFTISTQPLFANNKLKIIILKQEVKEELEFVLGLLNSRLLTYLHRLIAPPKSNNYFEVKSRIIGRLPIKRINFLVPAEKAKHDSIASSVKLLLAKNAELSNVKSPHEVKLVQRQIIAIEREIDRAVYELYELTREEVLLVEQM
jgi:type I restriction-modification system DNA methylase subunit